MATIMVQSRQQFRPGIPIRKTLYLILATLSLLPLRPATSTHPQFCQLVSGFRKRGPRNGASRTSRFPTSPSRFAECARLKFQYILELPALLGPCLAKQVDKFRSFIYFGSGFWHGWHLDPVNRGSTTSVFGTYR